MSPSARAGPSWQLQLAAAPVTVTGEGSRFALAAFDAALLAWLALEGPTPRARLAALLWPDKDADAARNSLRQRLFQLRKQLGVELVSGSTTLALADGVVHDLDDADSVLGAAAADDIAHGEFAHWLEQQRARRRDRVRRSLVELAEQAEQAKDLDDALAHARELLALEPLSEDAHRRVMRLHYLRGDRAAALLAFDRCERTLKDEVGARPSAETLALLATIEQSQRSHGGLVVGPSVVPASVLRPPRLVGREREWAQLREAWDARGALAVVGEAGMGKSRLVGDFAQAQGRTLVTSARPGDARVVYASLSRLLRQLPREALLALPDGVGRELARLLPELGDSPPSSEDRTRLFNAVAAALDSAALDVEGFVFDDLHFADDASVELLRYVAAGARRRWWVAARAAELSVAGRAWLADLAGDAQALTINLPPLGAPQIVQLLQSLAIDGLDAQALAPELLRHTGGNPMYLLETVRTWLSREGGSLVEAAPRAVRLPAARSVATLVERRIGRLSAQAVRLARCAAVAGQDFSAALASSVLSVPALDLADAWTELEQALVLRDGAFAHDLIYEAALASVPTPIARELHLQIARFLQAHDGEPNRTAVHWIAGGEPLRAVPFLRAAARQAMLAFRYSESAQGHAQAAQILERFDQRREAFDAWFDAADAISSIGGSELLQQAIVRAEALAEGDAEVAKAAVMRAVLECEHGRFDSAMQVAQRGLEPARRAGLAEQQSELLYILGVIHWDRREVSAAVAHTEQALALRRSLPPDALRPDHMNALITMVQGLGSMLGGAGRFVEARERVTEAYRLSVEHGRPHSMLGAAGDLCLRTIELGDLAAAQQWAERGVSACAAHESNAGDRVRFRLARAAVLMVSGQWSDALAQFDEVAGDLDPGLDRRRADVLARTASFYAMLGRRDLGLRLLRQPELREQATAAQLIAIDTSALELGERIDVPALLERVVATEDVGLRARLLVRLARHGEPAMMLPVLGIAATTMRDGGQLGLWLSLQGRRAALFARQRRDGDAAQAAGAAWAQVEAGTTPATFEADFCLDVACGWAAVDPQRAQVALEQARSRFGLAAQTMASPWREICLLRSPLQQRLAALGADLARSRDALAAAEPAAVSPARRAPRRNGRGASR